MGIFRGEPDKTAYMIFSYRIFMNLKQDLSINSRSQGHEDIKLFRGGDIVLQYPAISSRNAVCEVARIGPASRNCKRS